MKILGIDEAGRGCVLGDLFVGGYCCTEEQLAEIKEAGATDSKKISPKKRVRILEALKQIGTGEVIQITPLQIDNGNININDFCFLLTNLNCCLITLKSCLMI